MKMLQLEKYYHMMKEEAKLAYSPLGKAFEKQTKAVEEQGRKPSWSFRSFRSEKKNQKPKSIERLFPKEMKNDEIKNKIDKIKKWENTMKRKYSEHETNRIVFDFQQF